MKDETSDCNPPADPLQSPRKVPVGVLGSGKGSNFAALLDAAREGNLPVEFRVVGSDHADAGILELARGAGIPTLAIDEPKFRTRLSPHVEEEVAVVLREHGCEWLLLAGYMRVVKEPLLRAFPDKIINIHPSLLPKFRGLAAWKQALEAGEKVTGCTVHIVNEELDAGPILGQAEVAILPEDTPETLHARIQTAEHELFPRVLRGLFQA
jgi:phosphoribosylglycinamide formyltransferase-1